MDKTQDADLEKGYETIDDVAMYSSDDRAARFDDDEDDLFEAHPYEENELDYEPDGAFLD